jgi:chaperonin GroES
MSVKLQPLADYVVAVAEEAETKTASGLYLTESAQEKPKTAKVLAVGKAVEDVKVSDRIIYKSYGPTEVRVGAEDYLVIKQDDIIAIVTEGK